MMEWLAEKADVLAFLLDYPLLLLFLLAVFWLSYRQNMRLVIKANRNNLRARYAGLHQDAKVAIRKHDTGIGTQSALVLRPVGTSLSAILAGLFFFGGCAAVIWFLELADPAERTVKNILAFLFCLGFVGFSILALFSQLTRIELLQDRIIQRRFLRRSRSFPISEIADVENLGKAPGAGVILVFVDGRRLRLPASFAGYHDALQALRSAHPKFAGFVFLSDFTRNALKRKT